MFNEMYLLMQLPKINHEFADVSYLMNGFEHYGDAFIKEMYERVDALSVEITNTNYDLILNTKNSLYLSYDNMDGLLENYKEMLTAEMIKRKLVEVVESKEMSNEELDELKKQLKEKDIERKRRFFIGFKEDQL